jgi:hypothetical protein
MKKPLENTEEVALIKQIAVAIQHEFAREDLDDFPGFQDAAKAGQVNRAYRVAARCILSRLTHAASQLPLMLSQSLDVIARWRLEAHALETGQIEDLLAFEPPGRDD